MNSLVDFMESGIMEMYVLGQTSATESLEVESLAMAHPTVRQELAAIQQTLESYVRTQAVQPPGHIKSELLAVIDFHETLKLGEKREMPPLLTENSTREAYAPWLDRADMVAPADFSGIYAKIIALTEQASISIVWITDMAGEETHHQEYERFLILEGTCTVQVGEELYALYPGDNFAVPLHTPHRVQVTSSIPCKVILQRVAA